MPVVTLSPAEIYWAACAGCMRHAQNLKNAKQPRHGIDAATADWQAHIEGALGEMALAKHLRIYWPGKGELTDPDVGPLEVRTTPYEHGKLILHPSDGDDSIFWLLTGFNGTYNVRGWISGRDGKRDIYWSDPVGGRPAFFVPQDALSGERAADTEAHPASL